MAFFRWGGFLQGSLFLLLASGAHADSSSDPIDFFESKVRPIFAEHCYTCHSEKAEKIKGGLRLDSAEALLKGGTTGPAIVRGEPDNSLLIKAIRYSDPDLQMPPKNKKLSAEQIATLETWVKIGAPIPAVPVIVIGVAPTVAVASAWSTSVPRG